MKIDTHFTDEDWARIERDWTAWWRHELDRPLVMLNGLDARGRLSFAGSLMRKRLKLRRATFWDQLDHPVPTLFPLDVPAEEVIEAYGELLSGIRCFGDCWPRWWPNFGPGIMAGFLGGRVNSVPGTVWFDRAEPVDVSTWCPSDDSANPWRLRILELTRLAVERWGGAVSVGVTDLGGNLDILASLRGTQQLLLDTIEQPEAVARLAGEINRLWLRHYDELYELIRPAHRGTTPWAHVWSPGRTYMLQCDFSYMISPAMFERFVLPDLEACCAALDHAFYHLDGKGEIPHLDLLLSLSRLRGIQWIPGDGSPPPEKWLPLLKRIRNGGKLCQLYVSPEGALEIVRELGGKGFALYVNTPMSRSRAEAFLKTIMSASK
jgi:5-methyltetrahydrofolate--homocysteine methyltransferase